MLTPSDEAAIAEYMGWRWDGDLMGYCGKGGEMKSIVDELKDANKRGVAPPQNWTHRAIEEIDGLKKANSDLARAAIEKPPYKDITKKCTAGDFFSAMASWLKTK